MLFRSYETGVFCRDRRETWESKGGLSLQEKAEREAERIIQQTEVPGLTDEQTRELDKIEKRIFREA